MASNKRRPDMHWDRPVADVKRVVNVKRGTAEDVVMYLGPCGPLDRETRRQEAAAVAALRDGDEAANVWGIAARLWINTTDRESNRTATGCACTTDRAAAEDRKAAALLGPRGSGRIKGWRAALRARRAEVAVDALKCERRPAEAAEGGVWGTVAESAATLKMMGIWRMAEGEWTRQGEAEARRAERANGAEVVTVRRADGTVSTYVPGPVEPRPVRNITKRMTRAATRGTAEAAEARAVDAARKSAARAEGEGRAARKAAEAARSAARRAAARAARKA